MTKILVIWPVHRQDWVNVFNGLSESFQLIFLPSIFEEKDNYVEGFAETIFWSDFTSSQEILDRVNPDKLVFMSIDSGLSMLLNREAKKRKIETLILQHGIYTNYKDYRNRERIWRKKEIVSKIKQEKSKRSFSTLKFAVSSLSLLDLRLILLIHIYQLGAKNKGPYWASKHLPIRLKRANRYLCFSPYNSRIHREVDRIGDDEITYIGSPELENYLTEEAEEKSERYYLHIDQALAENSFGEETVSKEEMIEYYTKLNEFCISKNAKLYIKLHPESYESDWLPKYENINYLRNLSNFNACIQNAIGCFGFYSTMIIPAVYWKPTILFHIQYSGLQDELNSKFNVPILDFRQFDISDIQFGELADKSMIQEVFMSYTNEPSIARIEEALKY